MNRGGGRGRGGSHRGGSASASASASAAAVAYTDEEDLASVNVGFYSVSASSSSPKTLFWLVDSGATNHCVREKSDRRPARTEAELDAILVMIRTMADHEV